MNSELSEPLTSATSIVDEELGDSGDPYFVFRADLQTKLEMVDEALTEYLRIVHETVGLHFASFLLLKFFELELLLDPPLNFFVE